jgi:hypothetical protein
LKQLHADVMKQESTHTGFVKDVGLKKDGGISVKRAKNVKGVLGACLCAVVIC